MDYNKIYKIITMLDSLSHRRANKLKSLVSSCLVENDPKRIKEAEKKVHNYVYNLYLKSLSKKSRDEVYNTSMIINEDCHSVEQDAIDGWYIFMDGAKRTVPTEDGELIFTDIIPREYKEGFKLNDNPTAKELNFYLRYRQFLDSISKHMDRKQELTTFDYQTKTPFIPIEFVEALIDFIGLHRIPEKKQVNNK